MKLKIGVIADTHGTVPDQVFDHFRGVDQIVHAGDVGGLQVLESLQSLAPVVGVAGNYDTDPEVRKRLLPDPSSILLAGLKVFLTHRMFTMDWDQIKGEVARVLAQSDSPPRLVIFGHTHFPVLEEIAGVWFVNPGYCGPDPLEGPSSVAVLEIEGWRVQGRIIRL